MSVLVETNDRGWLINSYNTPREIERYLWVIYGNNARLVLDWLDRGCRAAVDKPKEAA